MACTSVIGEGSLHDIGGILSYGCVTFREEMDVGGRWYCQRYYLWCCRPSVLHALMNYNR